MSGWPSVSLDSVCDITIGKTPPRNDPKYWGEGHRWLSIADMSQGRELRETKERIAQVAIEDGVSGHLVEPGTVLMSFKLSIGKLGVAMVPMYTNEAIAALAIRDTEKLLSDYLYHALGAVDLQVGTDRAVMGKTLNKRKLRQIKIALPPLSEQRRIAAILDKADAVRRKRQRTLDLAHQFLRSAFLHVVGPKAVGYGEWPEYRMQDLAAPGKGTIRTGPFGSDLRHSEFVASGIAVLGIDNAVQNRFAWGESRFITESKYEKLKRYTVYPGDVIITIMGTTGRSAVVPEDIPTAITTKHLLSITPNRELVEPEFIAHAIHTHPAILSQIQRANRGAIMSGLNMTLIKDLKLPVPPLLRQQRFAEAVAKTRETAFRADAAREDVEDLFSSLVQRAFRGEL